MKYWPPGGEITAQMQTCYYSRPISISIICGKHWATQDGDMLCRPDMNPEKYLWPVNLSWVSVTQWGKMSGHQAKQLAYELLAAGADKVDWVVMTGVKERQRILNPVDIMRFIK